MSEKSTPTSPTASAYPSEKLAEAIDAVKCIRSGDTVFVSSGCAAPTLLLEAMAARAPELYHVEVDHILIFGPAPHLAPGMETHFRHNALFTGFNARTAVNEGRADYTPIFLGEIPRLYANGWKHVDVVLVHVSPPDSHGFCSLGIDCAATLAPVRMAKYVIGLINPQMPRVYGENFIHKSRFHRMVEWDSPLHELPREAMSDLHGKIGSYIADLIPNGACLQLGIGGIPDATLNFLRNKKDLGMHTEMFSDSAVDLVNEGIINCRAKNYHKDKMVASFVLGSQKLYDFVRENPLCEFRPVDHTNDPFIIARNDNMIAVNSAISVDITGQVNSDSIGHNVYSGFGGQVDFMRGASRSKGGKPIIGLPSTTKNDTVSKIVFELAPGAGVVTTRADAHYVATEFGVAHLHGKSIRERALQLINIAHPKFRDELRSQAKKAKII
ncbi:acetyl-CoA hydrolase/transferase family protein [candidate division KSB1 bacterium]|nr:MAG: acetyl-CoA hydrolase/transferase family protein [candidate division KSB1 bacterium]